MPDFKDFLPPPPWEGPPIPRALLNEDWVESKWPIVVKELERLGIRREAEEYQHPGQVVVDIFGIGLFKPHVERTLKTYFCGYTLIALNRYTDVIVSDTYRAARRIFKEFKNWYYTRGEPAESYFRTIAHYFPDGQPETFSECYFERVDEALDEAEYGGSKIIAVDTFANLEHLDAGFMMGIYIGSQQEIVPKRIDIIAITYYQTLLGGGLIRKNI